jgi:hypothetical protein
VKVAKKVDIQIQETFQYFLLYMWLDNNVSAWCGIVQQNQNLQCWYAEHWLVIFTYHDSMKFVKFLSLAY